MEETFHGLAIPILTDLRLSSRDTDKLTKALRILGAQAVMWPVPRFFGREGDWCVRVLLEQGTLELERHPEAAENEVGRQQRVHTPLRLADPLGNQCDRSLLLEGHPS